MGLGQCCHQFNYDYVFPFRSFTFSLSFSIFHFQLADILQAFLSPHIPFQNVPILSLVVLLLQQLGFLLFICKISWRQSRKFYFACRICNVYQIVFPLVFLPVFFALVPLWYLEYIQPLGTLYVLTTFVAFLVFGYLFFLCIDVSPLIVSVSNFHFGLLICQFCFSFLV